LIRDEAPLVSCQALGVVGRIASSHHYEAG
jgi:hypothetical protein